MAVKHGDKVKVEYTGMFEDGSVFDSSEKHGGPLEVELGKNQVIPGFENALLGMNPGEEKEITLQPKEAYGDHNPDLIKVIPREKVPKEAEKGMMLGLMTSSGQAIPALVVDLDDSQVKLDVNHPLAGKVLKFRIKLVA